MSVKPQKTGSGEIRIRVESEKIWLKMLSGYLLIRDYVSF